MPTPWKRPRISKSDSAPSSSCTSASGKSATRNWMSPVRARNSAGNAAKLARASAAISSNEGASAFSQVSSATVLPEQPERRMNKGLSRGSAPRAYSLSQRPSPRSFKKSEANAHDEETPRRGGDCRPARDRRTRRRCPGGRRDIRLVLVRDQRAAFRDRRQQPSDVRASLSGLQAHLQARLLQIPRPHVLEAGQGWAKLPLGLSEPALPVSPVLRRHSKANPMAGTPRACPRAGRF